MKTELVFNLPPSPGNPRNSEGAFLRGKRGEILFAYSRYFGESCHDHATCDVVLMESADEGKTWSPPRTIARAKEDFGTKNIMSISAMEQKNGDLAFYFLIKEKDFTTSLGRTVCRDGESFTPERCIFDMPPAYYVVNNDRLIRTRDGRILAPCEWVTAETCRAEKAGPYYTSCLWSDDDGKTFQKADFDFTEPYPCDKPYGLQEPGILEREGELYLWMRTGFGRQYESRSLTGLEGFERPHPSPFTSPLSPMQIKAFDGAEYAVYNPIPRANGYRTREAPGTWGRTPIVLRKSSDGGKTWGVLNTIEDDPTRGYSYPAMFFTKDGHLLVAYGRGNSAEGNNLCTLGISRIDLSTVEE